MLGKLKALIDSATRRSDNIYPVKVAMVQFTGNGAANPTVVHSYGCTVARNAAGVYRVTINSQLLGKATTTNSCIALHHRIAPTANTAFFDSQALATGLAQFDISVYEITQGAGATLARAAYDIIAGDVIDFAVYLNAGSGVLPNG